MSSTKFKKIELDFRIMKPMFMQNYRNSRPPKCFYVIPTMAYTFFTGSEVIPTSFKSISMIQFST